MKLIFGDGAHYTIRGCELCLQPMRYLGDHAGRRLFRCEDCALVITEDVDVRRAVALSGQRE
jgi:hypothetical protein